jgi:hypothetical protein
MIETLDAFGELILRSPWHSVGVVMALNAIVIGLWVAFEKRRERTKRGHDGRRENEQAKNSH